MGHVQHPALEGCPDLACRRDAGKTRLMLL
jgi:hypothetical protein